MAFQLLCVLVLHVGHPRRRGRFSRREKFSSRSGEGEEDWAMGRKQKRPTADFFEELAHLLRARLFAAVALAFFFLGRHPEPDFKASLFQFPLT